MARIDVAAPNGNTPSIGDILGARLGGQTIEPATSRNAGPAASAPEALTADKQQIHRFVTTLFRRCILKDGLPFGGRFNFRALQHRGDRPVLYEWEPLAGSPIARAIEHATRIARRGHSEAAVFAPPVCLFADGGRARESDVLACPVIVVELDASPSTGRRQLETVLGPATLVVASGGRWTSPDGVTEDKLHLYWRLSSPAVHDGEKALLRDVRARAAALVGADTTAVPLSHPLRWPGSWHTKGEPRLCRIVAEHDSEISLEDAAARLGVDIAAAKERQRGVRTDGRPFTTRSAWTPAQLMDAAEHLPNLDLDWDQWCTTGMAFYDAAHGSDEGFVAFDRFSRKSKLYDEENTIERYDHFSSSPPDRISGAWLVDRIRQQVDPIYVPPRPALSEVESAECREIWTAAGERQRAEIEAETASKPVPGLRIVTGPIAPSSIPVRKWLVAPRLPIGDVCQCVGEPGISKSTFTLRDALAIATGREDILRGKGSDGQPISWERLHRSGSVLIYNAEDRLDEMERRLTAAQRHVGLGEHDVQHPIILWSGVDHEHLIIMRRAQARDALIAAPGLASLEATIRQYGVVFVALDPQVSLVSNASENGNDDQDALFQELARLAFRTDCSILIVHHTSKQTREAAGDMGAGRGAFAAVGKVRSAFTLTNLTGNRDDEKGWLLEGTNAGLIRLDYSKLSHERKPTTPLVFRRVTVSVGNGSGVRPEAAAALFDQEPRAALEMAGDNAPVLELVDTATLAASTAANRPVQHADVIGQIVSEVIGDRSECAFGAVYAVIGERLREAGVMKATARPGVTGKVISALVGKGIELQELGQIVLVRAEQRGSGEKAPWWITKATTPTTEAN